MLSAAKDGDIKRIESLLSSGNYNIDAYDKEENTALHWTVYNGKAEAVQKLLSLGASANIKNNKGSTSLHWAVYNGYPTIVEVLVNFGADVNIEDKN